MGWAEGLGWVGLLGVTTLVVVYLFLLAAAWIRSMGAPVSAWFARWLSWPLRAWAVGMGFFGLVQPWTAARIQGQAGQGWLWVRVLTVLQGSINRPLRMVWHEHPVGLSGPWVHQLNIVAAEWWHWDLAWGLLALAWGLAWWSVGLVERGLWRLGPVDWRIPAVAQSRRVVSSTGSPLAPVIRLAEWRPRSESVSMPPSPVQKEE